MVKKINPDNSKTIYIGGIYEVDKSSGGSVTRTVTYYPGGAMRVDGTLYYILKDHLGSASVVTDASGNIVGEDRFYPFGETRLTTGAMYTDKLFTGQQEMAGLGIYNYRARFFSPKLGRFLSPDTIVPGAANPQNLNRYSYVLNSPVNFTDPSGHDAASTCGGNPSCMDYVEDNPEADFTYNWGNSGDTPNEPGDDDGSGDEGGGGPSDYCSTYSGACNNGGGLGTNIFTSYEQNNNQCQLGSNCFYATQADVFRQGNSMFWWGIGFGALSTS